MSEVPTRLLRETLRGAMTPEPSPACLDAETLAAWADGALSARDRAAAESHASSCARCQALLAAMVRTLPPAPARKWWQTSTFGWLVPIAVGAIAIVVWVNVPTSRSGRLARPPQPASAASSAAGASAGRAEAKDALREATPASPPAASPPQRPAGGEQRRAAAAPPRPAPESAMQSPPAAAELDQPRGAPAPASPAAPPPPLQSQTAAPPQIAAADAAAPAKPSAPVAAPMFREPPVYDQNSAGARAQAMAKALAAPAQIVSLNQSVRWRIVAAGRVDRSIDGGTTWERQATGVPVMLTSGAAPSPTVCWLVGPGGAVVQSIDGRTWQRVAFPATIDLASVRATDAVSATVTAVDGRTFVTGDGGKSWRTP
jgi:hypothetical protein